jgi:DNA-binding MarR family transcriptional regulator
MLSYKSAYAHLSRDRHAKMSDQRQARFQECNCLAIRQAARHVTQFYDQLLAPTGLRATQFAILSRLRRNGPMTINALAAALVMDRTTLGRNILPLERDGLIEVARGVSDRRRHELHLTETGLARYRAAVDCWSDAQTRFSTVFGDTRAAALRELLRDVTACDFAAAAD